MKTAIIATVVALMLQVAVVGSAQECGAPPGPFKYSDNFYRAEERLFQTDSATDASAKLVIKVPIGGDYHSSTSSSTAESLTVAQAHAYIVQEHTDRAANLIAECGYRACQLQNGSEYSPTAIALISQVCNPSLTPSAEAQSQNQIKVEPQDAVVVFHSSKPLTRSIIVSNNLPTPVSVTAYIEAGSDGKNARLLKILSKASFRLDRKTSKTLIVASTRPSSGEIDHEDVVVQLRDDASVQSRARFTIVENASLLLPPPSISTGVLYPNAKIMHDQNDASPFTADQEEPQNLPIALRGPQDCNCNGGNGAAAHAFYSGTFDSPKPSADQISASMRIDASVGGVCGSGNASGSGGINPRYVTTLRLPGISREQKWTVTLVTDVLHTSSGAACKAGIDIDQQSISNSATTQRSFEVDPGEHTLEMTCVGTNPYFGCGGSPGKVHYEDQHYALAIKAIRQDVKKQVIH
jgi:hypothetical protein